MVLRGGVVAVVQTGEAESRKQRQMTWSSTWPRARARAPHEITVRAGANGNGNGPELRGLSPPNSWVESTKSINRSIYQLISRLDLQFIMRGVRMRTVVSTTSQHQKADRIQRRISSISLGHPSDKHQHLCCEHASTMEMLYSTNIGVHRETI
jgi:hypothetical protein